MELRNRRNHEKASDFINGHRGRYVMERSPRFEEKTFACKKVNYDNINY